MSVVARVGELVALHSMDMIWVPFGMFHKLEQPILRTLDRPEMLSIVILFDKLVVDPSATPHHQRSSVRYFSRSTRELTSAFDVLILAVVHQSSLKGIFSDNAARIRGEHHHNLVLVRNHWQHVLGWPHVGRT